MEKEIILASASPRRKELLQQAGIPFIVVPSQAEEIMNPDMDPVLLVQENAHRKAKYVADMYSDRIVLGSDTIVLIQNHILGKPKSRKHAREMLEMLSGNTHQVITGISFIYQGKVIRDSAISHVRFRNLNDAAIEKYLDTNEYVDKAGSYGIQGRGCVLVDSIEGDYFNIVGLPICKVNKILESIWDELSIDK